MRMTRLLGPAVFAVLIAGIAVQHAEAQSNRAKQKFGAHIGLLGDPFPTLVGLNANYNVLEFVRASIGYGSVTASGVGGDLTATTFGLGARAMVPDWNFSPVVGLSWATVSVTFSGSVTGGTVGGFGASGSHLYATFGVDWQTGSGFNLGAGYNLSLASGVGGLPYINLGWYFEL